MAQEKVNNLVVVSDTHCGCRLGLCPPGGVFMDEGGMYKPSKLQRKIWKMWREFWDEFVPSQPVENPTLSSSTETSSMESTTEAQPKSATTSKIRRLLPTSAWLRLWRRVKDATTTFVEQRRMSASRRETRKTSPSVSVPFPTKKVNTLAGTCGKCADQSSCISYTTSVPHLRLLTKPRRCSKNSSKSM